MRFDRRRTRGVALILTAFVVVVAGAGGGLAVTDFAGPPATDQSLSLQSDNVTTDDPGGESSGDASTEAATASDETSTATPDETGADEADAADESAASTSTPEPTDAAPSEEPESTGGEAESATEGTGPASEESESTEEAGPSTTEDAPPNGTDGAVANESAQDASADNATTATDDEGNATSSGEIASCTVIDEPGEYELAGNVDGGSGTCLAVEASGVVLDGNGHAVAGSGSGTGIHVAGGASDVTVRNVDVSDWGVGVALGGSGSGPTVNLVEVRATDSDTGVRLTGADGSAMQAVTASDNGDGVVLVDSADVQASDVTVEGNDGTGLWLTRGVADSSFSIVQATDNGDRGIHVSTGAVNNFVGDATVTDNGGPGVEFADSSNNVLADSRVERNDGPGVLSYPAGGDRLENVQLSDNGDGAYRDQAAVMGAVADTVTLGDGASVQFDQGVTRLASAGTPDSLPEGTEAVGPAVEVALRDGDGATATVTVPVDAADDVTAYQRVDGDWTEIDGVTVTDGEAEIPVSGSGVVVPVVESADSESTEATPDDGTATVPGGDTVRADASNEELAATDGSAASDDSSGSEPAADEDDVAASDESAATDDAQSGATAAVTNGVPASRYAFDAERFADLSARGTAQYEDRSQTLVIGPAAVDDPIEYSFVVDGEVSKIESGNVTAEANDSVSQTNGTVTVDGTTSAGDAYAVDGNLTAIRQTGGSDGFFVRYDGPIGADESAP